MTRSPALTPSSVSALAALLTSRLRSAYVIVRVSPGSPSQWKATLSPLPASTWRSTQLTATLSRPPMNHLANGGCQSSTWSHSVSHCSALGLLFPEGEPVLGGVVVEVGLGDRLRARTPRSAGSGVPRAAGWRGPRCSSVHDLLLSPDAGHRPDLELGVLGLVVLLAQDREEPPAEESHRDGHKARVVQREEVEVDAGVGHQRRALGGALGAGLPDTTGEKITKVTAVIRPP